MGTDDRAEHEASRALPGLRRRMDERSLEAIIRENSPTNGSVSVLWQSECSPVPRFTCLVLYGNAPSDPDILPDPGYARLTPCQRHSASNHTRQGVPCLLVGSALAFRVIP
jgi:hypothetical protein